MFRKSFVVLCAVALLSQPSLSFAFEKIDFDQGVDVRQTLQSVKSVDASGIAAQDSKSILIPKDAKMSDGSDVRMTRNKGAAEWTIMVFINGKNNLESYGAKDVNEMEVVGSDENTNVVVELGAMDVGAKRMLVAKDDKPGEVTSQSQDIGKVDMGDWKHLVDFGQWAKKTYPARHYMLVVWNHGSGWDKKKDEVGARGISYDDETGNHITTQQLGQALAAMGGVDVYGSDACLMQMAEVSYELKDYAGVIVGSEETEPGDGWDYTGFLKKLAGKPGASAEDVGKAVMDSYNEYYGNAGQGGTQSYVRSQMFEDFVGAVKAWTSAVMAAGEKDVVKAARKSVQSYAVSDNVDLIHFVNLIGGKTQNGSVKSSGQALVKFVQEKLVAGNAVTGSYGNSGGIAVYLPKYSVSSAYADLAWAKASSWGDFAQYVLKAYKEGAASDDEDNGGSGDDSDWGDWSAKKL